MASGRMVPDPTVPNVWGSSPPIRSQKKLDEEIDRFAQQLLNAAAEESPSIDESLGAYVTSRLREAPTPDDFDALCELLQEHCNISNGVAENILRTIVDAVSSGNIPTDDQFRTLSLATIDINDKFDNSDAPSQAVISVLAAGKLLPGDLLEEEDENDHQTDDRAFPPLGASLEEEPVRKLKSRGSLKGVDKSAAEDELKSVLFQQSRSRQSSVDETHAVQPEQPPIASDHIFRAAELLLSMNADLSSEAAVSASSLTHGDVNAAHYLIGQVASQAPVCRHLLTDGCYRSDCQFSHDIDNHTCLFWLKSRCGKGSQCRFVHGFSDSLVEYLIHPPQEAYYYDEQSYEQPYTSWMQQALPVSTNSFANVASQGFGTQSFADDDRGPKPEKTITIPTVKIPIDVWSVHENRDASAFYIADPIERYKAVQKTVARADVMDLHFQSLKTYGIVLDTLLDSKLRELEQVWIVTGTGHHVGKSHQKAGGALENAVLEYLATRNYNVARGRDGSGQGGAILVKR